MRKLVSWVFTKGWEVVAENGQGVTLQNDEWSPETKLQGCYWLPSGWNTTEIKQKIKLTAPVDSYTTILLVQALILLKADFNRCIFWRVWKARMMVFGLVKDCVGVGSYHGFYNYLCIDYTGFKSWTFNIHASSLATLITSHSHREHTSKLCSVD